MIKINDNNIISSLANQDLLFRIKQYKNHENFEKKANDRFVQHNCYRFIKNTN